MGTPKEKFDAAVRVIGSLPKEGSFKPSNELLLRFYSLYKQATEGPCRQPRPGFWDPVSRYKWDAWHSLGDMHRETAMLEYVEELKKVVETMPHTPDVEKFLDSLGSFYEVVLDRDASPAAAAEAAPSVTTFEIDEPAAVESASAFSSSSSSSCPEPADAATHQQHHHRNLNGDEEAEEEFCDSLDRPSVAASVAAAAAAAPGGPAASRSAATTAAATQLPLPTSEALKQPQPQPPQPQSAQLAEALRQARLIRDSLAQLQADVDRVHARLDGLESAPAASSDALAAPRSVWRRLFGEVSPAAVAFVLLWPPLLQLLALRLRSKSKRS